MSDKAQQLDLSIIIVHTFEKYLIRQTLDSIRRAAPKARAEFPQVRHIPLERNVGFGSAMNRGIDVARGRYVLIFNPDIVIQPESLETMLEFMDANPEVGMCGPQLRNPDGSLQYSCYRSPTLMVPAYRRTFLGKFGVGKQAIEDYLMMDQSHDQQMEVDSLIGAALFTRKTALDEVGSFDERFFMYYEDNDIIQMHT